VHRDVKSTNILLTASKDVAKVGDFGLSRLAPGEDGSLTFVKGTRGYIDPEYVSSHYLTTKSDVFSFGVVLLELLTGRLPLSSPSSSDHAWTLCDWARTTLQSGSDPHQILDPALLSPRRPRTEAAWKAADLAMMCVEPKSLHRPSMAEVVQELRSTLTLEEAHSLPSSDLSSAFSFGNVSFPAPR
jgi:serine/threonine protein kinase